MLTYTLKNYINYLNEYAEDNKYELIVRGMQTKYIYKFTIKDGIMLSISKGSVDRLLLKIEDIENLQLDDEHFKPVKLTETTYRPDNTVYEKSEKNIYYEVQLYIKLFRLMRERVNFVFKHRNKFYYCYYVDGKILYIEEDENNYNVRGTDFFTLGTTHAGFKILYVSPSIERLKYGDFLDVHNKCAITKHKTFNKYKYNMKLD